MRQQLSDEVVVIEVVLDVEAALGHAGQSRPRDECVQAIGQHDEPIGRGRLPGGLPRGRLEARQRRVAGVQECPRGHAPGIVG
jgi:hypothetical protein